MRVVPSAVTNWQRRDVLEAHGIPEPAYYYGVDKRPLWTREQMEEVAADSAARIRALLDG